MARLDIKAEIKDRLAMMREKRDARSATLAPAVEPAEEPTTEQLHAQATGVLRVSAEAARKSRRGFEQAAASLHRATADFDVLCQTMEKELAERAHVELFGDLSGSVSGRLKVLLLSRICEPESWAQGRKRLALPPFRFAVLLIATCSARARTRAFRSTNISINQVADTS